MIKNVVENENVYFVELRFFSYWNSVDMNFDNMLSLLFSVLELFYFKLNFYLLS